VRRVEQLVSVMDDETSALLVRWMVVRLVFGKVELMVEMAAWTVRR